MIIGLNCMADRQLVSWDLHMLWWRTPENMPATNAALVSCTISSPQIAINMIGNCDIWVWNVAGNRFYRIYLRNKPKFKIDMIFLCMNKHWLEVQQVKKTIHHICQIVWHDIKWCIQ